MLKAQKKMFISTIVFMFIATAAYRAVAIGMVSEFPFLGTYSISCGYHTKCSAPTSPGFGLDFVHSTLPTYGKVVYASGRGTVTTSGTDSAWGETIVIDHPDTYYSRYAHLQWRFALVNQKMREGSPIGYMGHSGCGTCGDHLHFQVYNVNPQTGAGVEPIPIDGRTTSFCTMGDGTQCGSVTNNSFATDMRLVDNTDSSFSLTGTAPCTNNTTNGYHKDGLNQSVVYYRYCNGTFNTPTRTGTWTPSLPATASYHVYAFIPNHDGISLSGYAEYKIYSNNALIATVAVIQNTPNNRWVSLGQFNLNSSGSYIKLTNLTLDSGIIAYDAIMFVRDF